MFPGYLAMFKSQDFAINSVFAFHEICSEELRVEREVREVLRKHQQGTGWLEDGLWRWTKNPPKGGAAIEKIPHRMTSSHVGTQCWENDDYGRLVELLLWFLRLEKIIPFHW